jgi:hypothetical protein
MAVISRADESNTYRFSNRVPALGNVMVAPMSAAE